MEGISDIFSIRNDGSTVLCCFKLQYSIISCIRLYELCRIVPYIALHTLYFVTEQQYILKSWIPSFKHEHAEKNDK